MITVKRTDYKSRTIHYRNGRESVIPARYECRYLHNGREIATYDSKDDVLYLKTDYIGSDFKRPPYDRALTCAFKEAYSHLFQMLNVDSTSSISEYTNL